MSEHGSYRLAERLRALYGDPISDSPDAVIGEYTRLLKGYSDDILSAAFDLVAKRHRGPQRWPRVADCVAACEDAIRASEAVVARQPAPHPYPAWSRARIERADALIRSEMGREAADEGWIVGLWDHCRHHERLPDERERAQCRRDARAFNEAYAGLGGGPLDAVLQRLGGSMLARRDELAGIAHGEVR